MLRLVAFALLVGSLHFTSAATLKAAEPMYRFLLDGKEVEGSPLLWQDSFGALLTRDGRWLNVDPRKAEGLRQASSSFRPHSAVEFRALLQQEFGSGYGVSGDGHYLVVYPAGERDAWASRFEQLYRAFIHYFTARGWRPNEPQFPLVAVVFSDQRRFQEYAEREGSKIASGTIGYYSPVTNRIALYNVARENQFDWSVNAETIIHEAAHQVAFNTGVHNRFAQPPRWVAEGLGTLFEARGVWNAGRHRSQSDRVNRYRCEAFKQYAKSRRPASALADLISSDRPFETDAEGAYALTFFLSETEPRRYVEYLRTTAAQPNFTQRRAPERLADFTSVFGDNLKLLDARMLRFFAELK
jgi:hypothetical protein